MIFFTFLIFFDSIKCSFKNNTDCSSSTKFFSEIKNSDGKREQPRKRDRSVDLYEFGEEDRGDKNIYQRISKRIKVESNGYKIDASSINYDCNETINDKYQDQLFEVDMISSLRNIFDYVDMLNFLKGFPSKIEMMLNECQETIKATDEDPYSSYLSAKSSDDLLKPNKCTIKSTVFTDTNDGLQNNDRTPFSHKTKPEICTLNHTQDSGLKEYIKELESSSFLSINRPREKTCQDIVFNINTNKNIHINFNDIKAYQEFEFTIKEDFCEHNTTYRSDICMPFEKDKKYKIRQFFNCSQLENTLFSKEKALKSKKILNTNEIIDFLETSDEEIAMFIKTDHHFMLKKEVVFSDETYENMKTIFKNLSESKFILQILPEYRVFDLTKNRYFFKENRDNAQKLSKYIELCIFSLKMNLLIKYLLPINIKQEKNPYFMDFSYFIFRLRELTLKKTSFIWKEPFYMIYKKISHRDYEYKRKYTKISFTEKYTKFLKNRWVSSSNIHSALLRIVFEISYDDIMPVSEFKYSSILYSGKNNEKRKNPHMIYKSCSFYIYFLYIILEYSNEKHLIGYIGRNKRQKDFFEKIFNLYIQNLRKIYFYKSYFEYLDSIITTLEKNISNSKMRTENLMKKEIYNRNLSVKKSMVILNSLDLYDLQFNDNQ